MDRAHQPSIQQPMVRFRAFWAELEAVVAQIRQQKWTASPRTESPTDRNGDARDPQSAAVDIIFRRLRDAVLTHGGAPAARSAYAAAPIDLGYIMAALADETLLYHESWGGMSLWSRTMLEERIYGTRNAGERLFAEAQTILGQRTGEHDEIAVGLLLAITLGFRGKYRLMAERSECEAEANRLRGRLYQAIFYAEAPLHLDWQSAFSYPPPFEAGRLYRLPQLRPWLGAIAAVIGLYLIISHVLWATAFSSTMTMADDITVNGPVGRR